MFIYIIYILISLILIFVTFIGIKAASMGIYAKRKIKYAKNFNRNKQNIVTELSKLSQLRSSGVITKQEYQKAKKKILKN